MVRSMKREVILAQTLGFCGGVKAAVGLAEGEALKEGQVYTLGSLVHNRQVQQRLEEQGIRCLNSGETLPEKNSRVIIRSHGVPPQEQEQLKQAGLTVLDGTCPKVKKSQQRIADYASRGYWVLIAGERDHGEVLGLMGCAGEKARVISIPADMDALSLKGPVFLTCQTTFPEAVYREIEALFFSKYPQGEALSALCRATELRQKALKEMIPSVDAVIVVGGHHSSNTRNLYDIARDSGRPCWWVEEVSELDLEALASYGSFGITAGASTPDESVERVALRLKDF